MFLLPAKKKCAIFASTAVVKDNKAGIQRINSGANSRHKIPCFISSIISLLVSIEVQMTHDAFAFASIVRFLFGMTALLRFIIMMQIHTYRLTKSSCSYPNGLPVVWSYSPSSCTNPISISARIIKDYDSQSVTHCTCSPPSDSEHWWSVRYSSVRHQACFTGRTTGFSRCIPGHESGEKENEWLLLILTFAAKSGK